MAMGVVLLLFGFALILSREIVGLPTVKNKEKQAACYHNETAVF